MVQSRPKFMRSTPMQTDRLRARRSQAVEELALAARDGTLDEQQLDDLARTLLRGM